MPARKKETTFEAFSFPTSAFEIPSAFREAADKSVTQFRDSYEKMKTATEDATAMVEETMETARANALGMGEKTMEAARVNGEASFELMRDMFAVKSVSELVELQTAFARKQFDTATAQFKEFQELSTKFVTDTTKPVTASVEKTMKEATDAVKGATAAV